MPNIGLALVLVTGARAPATAVATLAGIFLLRVLVNVLIGATVKFLRRPARPPSAVAQPGPIH